jgi:XTP/dITP diphosphohydrolase
MQSQWVLASSNQGKLKEFAHALAPFLAAQHLELINQSTLGIDAAEEPFDTFEDNALAKARHAARVSGLPALADDSGLCVAALGGAPGVRSARFYADAVRDGQVLADRFSGCTADEANVQWLLDRMSGQTHRSAQFCAAIVWVRHADDPDPIVVTGFWRGQIALTPHGQQGFGYDPVFIDLESGCYAAEMSLEQKQRVSHRGKALKELLQRLDQAS